MSEPQPPRGRSAPTPTGTPRQTPAEVAGRLLRTAAKHTYDPALAIDWDAPPEPGHWYLQPERMSLYATPTWHRLSEERRLALSRSEWANMISMATWFELTLMQMLTGQLTARDPASPRTHYALSEVADETRHVAMFGRALGTLGCPAYRPPALVRHLGRAVLPQLRGASLFAAALLIEEVYDRFQREAMGDQRVQPLVRQVSRLHVMEESRHIRFAHSELLDARRGRSGAVLEFHRQLTAWCAMLAMTTYTNAPIYRAVGLDPRRAAREARANPHFRRTMRWAGERLVAFLTDAGMITALQRPLWRRSLLLG
ncbi:diiron oxygenase [Streptomyces sp. NPDC020125]|uniref:AurF N-oxygenase family protein n=1 Tax=Streptomyces sp. NPDC020125 TaxID=3154593 RepID=UPI0033C35D05